MEKKKNVIWIVVDQLRAQALGISGDVNVHTPNIDFLARNGAEFTNAVSGMPLCCPFRGSMLTSEYPHKCAPGHDMRMPQRQTIADVFNENGYDTCYIGKWHLDGGPVDGERAGTHFVPRKRRGGFQTWLGYENNNAQLDCWLHGHVQEREVDMFRVKGYETDALTGILLKYLEERKHKTTPFFAVLSVQPPHNPYVASPKFAKINPGEIQFRKNVPEVDYIRKQAAEELAGYYAMIEQIDNNVGKILEKLTDLEIIEDTHVIFFSDHGDMHGSHGQFRKTTIYEEAIKIPFIIGGEKLGGHEVARKSGKVEEVFINHVDIAPTTLGLCGISKPDWMKGYDYSSFRLLDKERAKGYPDSVYLQSVVPTGHHDSVNKAWRGILTKEGYKYGCFEGTDWVLFDLNRDPYEQVNLAHNDKYKVLRQKMKTKLEKWIAETSDVFQLPAEK